MSRYQVSEQTIRIIKSAGLYGCFFCVGMVLAITGPTATDLQNKTNTDSKTMSILIGARSVGAVLGSISAGLFMDKCNRQLAMASITLMLGVGAMGLPWWTQVVPMGAFMVISGLALGVLTIGGNVWILDLWGTSSRPFLQALHFFYGLGTFLIPLISVPFLAPSYEGGSTNVSNSSTDKAYVYPDDGLYVTVPYIILGSIITLVAVAILVSYLLFPKDCKRETLINELTEDNSQSTPTMSTYQKYGLIALGACFLLIDCGMETIFGLQLATYVVHSLGTSYKETGSYLTSVFYGTIVLTRGLSVLWSIKVSPRNSLIGNILVTIGASAFLVFLGDKRPLFLWIGTAGMGFGMSSIMPTTINWMESNFVVTSKFASIFNLAGAAGATILPVICGNFIEKYPVVLFYLEFGGALCLLAIFIAIVFYLKTVEKTQNSNRVNVVLKDPGTWTVSSG